MSLFLVFYFYRNRRSYALFQDDEQQWSFTGKFSPSRSMFVRGESACRFSYVNYSTLVTTNNTEKLTQFKGVKLTTSTWLCAAPSSSQLLLSSKPWWIVYVPALILYTGCSKRITFVLYTHIHGTRCNIYRWGKVHECLPFPPIFFFCADVANAKRALKNWTILKSYTLHNFPSIY